MTLYMDLYQHAETKMALSPFIASQILEIFKKTLELKKYILKLNMFHF